MNDCSKHYCHPDRYFLFTASWIGLCSFLIGQTVPPAAAHEPIHLSDVQVPASQSNSLSNAELSNTTITDPSVRLAGVVIPPEPTPAIPIPAAPHKGLLAPAPAVVPRANEPAFLGSQSCASTSCHGDSHRTNLLNSAYHIFMEHDPHVRAGSVLYNDRSQQMMNQLGRNESAWEAKDCLICHAPGAQHAANRQQMSTRVAEGVSCEACHGAAENWLEPHRSYVWRDSSIWPASRKAEAGFQVTKSLAVRAKMCADCHVGSEKAQVTHDFIAAGHPRLLFEFASTQSLMPAHWRRSDDRQRYQATTGQPANSFEAASWLMGQLISADREMDLLIHAAADESRPWPELAQYDCFACHHDLKPSSFRQTGQGKVQIRWGTWNLGLLQSAPAALMRHDPDSFDESGTQLVGMLESFSDDRQRVAQLARQQQQRLRHEIASQSASFFQLQSIENRRDLLLRKSDQLVKQGWDSSTQLYLAIVALEQGIQQANGRPGITDPELLKLLRAMRRRLAFQQVPRDTAPTVIYDSPRNFDETAILNINQLLRRFEQHVSGSKPEYRPPVLPSPN